MRSNRGHDIHKSRSFDARWYKHHHMCVCHRWIELLKYLTYLFEPLPLELKVLNIDIYVRYRRVVHDAASKQQTCSNRTAHPHSVA